MFELIGLLFATLLLFALASILSAALTGVTWLLIRNLPVPRKRLLFVAASIPLLSAGYFWFCSALLPGNSLYGDISQPLPNGYQLQALGKMPDFASISKTDASLSTYSGLSECIGKLTVYGPLVAGQYSHPFGSFDASPNEPFFIFDTRNGKHVDLPKLTDLEAAIGHPVRLTDIQSFSSQEPPYRLQKQINKIIMFGPPITAILIFGAYVLWHRSRTLQPPPNIYT